MIVKLAIETEFIIMLAASWADISSRTEVSCCEMRARRGSGTGTGTPRDAFLPLGFSRDGERGVCGDAPDVRTGSWIVRCKVALLPSSSATHSTNSDNNA